MKPVFYLIKILKYLFHNSRMFTVEKDYFSSIFKSPAFGRKK